jgi:hypothetical protein
VTGLRSTAPLGGLLAGDFTEGMDAASDLGFGDVAEPDDDRRAVGRVAADAVPGEARDPD